MTTNYEIRVWISDYDINMSTLSYKTGIHIYNLSKVWKIDKCIINNEGFNGCITVSTIFIKENFKNIQMHIVYSFFKKNMPYAYPLDWPKMPYLANTGSYT
jgi:hypothetical protein